MLLHAMDLARRLASAAWITAAGVAGHLAGQSAAFAVLLAAFAWLATVTRVGMAAASQKAYDTETRVDALVPAVASAQSTANTANSTANTAKNTANAALPASGGSINGDLHVNGTLYGSGGTLTCGDNLYTSQTMTAGGTITSHGALRGASTTGVGGQGTLADSDNDAVMGPISGNVSTGNVNSIIGQVNNLKYWHNQLASDMQGTIDRVNDILGALG